MRTAYWHKLSKETQEIIYKYSGLTYGEFIAKYRQPPWCSYPDALEGAMGCWSLIRPGWVREPDFCKDCDCFEA